MTCGVTERVARRTECQVWLPELFFGAEKADENTQANTTLITISQASIQVVYKAPKESGPPLFISAGAPARQGQLVGTNYSL